MFEEEGGLIPQVFGCPVDSLTTQLGALGRTFAFAVNDIDERLRSVNEEIRGKVALMEAQDGLSHQEASDRVMAEGGYRKVLSDITNEGGGLKLFSVEMNSLLSTDCCRLFTADASSQDDVVTEGFLTALQFPFIRFADRFYCFIGRLFMPSASFVVRRILHSHSRHSGYAMRVGDLYAKTMAALFIESDIVDVYTWRGHKVDVVLLSSLKYVNAYKYPELFQTRVERRLEAMAAKPALGHAQLFVDPDSFGGLERTPTGAFRISLAELAHVQAVPSLQDAFYQALFQDSISDIVSKQYDEILNYDASISFKNDATMLEKDDFMNQLKNDDRFEEVIGVEQLAVTVDNNGEDSSVTVVVPNDVNEFADFTTLRHRGESDTIALKDDGALISEKLAMNLGLGAGDVITVTDGDGFQREIKIADVVENYVGHYLYMSPSYFKEVFKERQNDTTVLVKTVSTDSDFENELGEELMGEDIVTSVSFYSGLASSFEDTISSLNFIVVVLVISAGLLAFVVLYNLTNVNISERVREIATIKVLGFYDKEVSSYVFRETIFLTIIGALAGLLLGIGLHRLIMSLAEMESVMFGRNIDALSYVISFVITLVFGGIVDLFMYRKLKKVQMVESLKSVE